MPATSRGSSCFQPRYSRISSASAVIEVRGSSPIWYRVASAPRAGGGIEKFLDLAKGLRRHSQAGHPPTLQSHHHPSCDGNVAADFRVVLPSSHGALRAQAIIDRRLGRRPVPRVPGHSVQFANCDRAHPLGVEAMGIVAEVEERAGVVLLFQQPIPSPGDVFLYLPSMCVLPSP